MPPVSIAFVIDKIESIKPYKDSTVAMMKAAQNRGIGLFYLTIDDLFIEENSAKAACQKLTLTDDKIDWYWLEEKRDFELKDFTVILMRKDPPVDKRFIHACYMLEHAVRSGAKVLNNPTALIALNEKLYAGFFPDLCPATTISSDLSVLKKFLDTHGKIIIKPLDAMGGHGVFMVDKNDVNFEVIWELHTQRGSYPVIAQEFIPAITDGDKRVIVINGKAFGHVLVRNPKAGSIRGNIAAGGTTFVRPINETEQKICDIVGPSLIKNGILFAGLDIIGDRLIEINITSPTGLKEISAACGTDLGDLIIGEILDQVK
ncbi:MAG: glutathione synthase [Micavibrio aeruginosavorus]|uniref:Glutathione synthetase n=1 Tax=Micavibrio aeruginosavorus TaxID=349221 RepID=A0A2W5FKY3_9BACT|nr:MAG: glutathione synthase [Micavibrio aeruginosavorus]